MLNIKKIGLIFTCTLFLSGCITPPEYKPNIASDARAKTEAGNITILSAGDARGLDSPDVEFVTTVQSGLRTYLESAGYSISAGSRKTLKMTIVDTKFLSMWEHNGPTRTKIKARFELIDDATKTELFEQTLQGSGEAYGPFSFEKTTNSAMNHLFGQLTSSYRFKQAMKSKP